MKILYLEDDINLSQTVCEFLEEEGFEVVCSYDGKDALDATYKTNFDLLLLDVHVEHLDGFELLKELRASSIETPAMFITSLDSISDLSRAYASGADDYIKKPFALKELSLRVNALLKRGFRAHKSLVEITQNAKLNILTHELIVDSNTLQLNPKEYTLLKHLIKRRGECTSFAEIYINVWGYEETHSYMSLRTYIKNLRKHIGKEHILSIKGIGYKLV
ncbi:MAG: response regulator transcription factor [Sulfurimonas sp.]|nr:response regulator transcription factor [Sulfurimonas sp.]MDD5203646.1 response regulator transcription factor [Sulfurimonas sp.]